MCDVRYSRGTPSRANLCSSKWTPCSSFANKCKEGRRRCYTADIELVVDTFGSPDVRTLHVVDASDRDFTRDVSHA